MRASSYLGGIALLWLGLCYFIATTYLRPSRVVTSKPEGAVDVTIPRLKYPIPAWSTPGLANGKPTAKPIFIFAHGYGGCRDTWVKAQADLAKLGYESVIPAMPGHDTNPDPTSGFGVKEADVLVRTVVWARRQSPGAKVIFVGVSLGGAACWLASESVSVNGIVCESSFPTLNEATSRSLGGVIPGGDYLFAPVRFFAAKLADLDPSTINPIDSARKWKGKPSLVIWDGADRLFPKSFSDRLCSAAGCPYWEIKGAAHSYGYVVAGKEFCARLVAMAKSIE